MTPLRTAAAALFVTSLAGFAVASESTAAEADCGCNDSPKTDAYRLQILSRATSLSCDAGDTFKHRLVLCSTDGCVSHDVTNASRLTFRVAVGDDIKVSSHSTYTKSGLVQGESVKTHEPAGFQGRFTQTVKSDGDCLRSVVFEVVSVTADSGAASG